MSCRFPQKYNPLIFMNDKSGLDELKQRVGGEYSAIHAEYSPPRECIAPGPLDTSLSYATRRSSSQSCRRSRGLLKAFFSTRHWLHLLAGHTHLVAHTKPRPDLAVPFAGERGAFQVGADQLQQRLVADGRTRPTALAASPQSHTDGPCCRRWSEPAPISGRPAERHRASQLPGRSFDSFRRPPFG